MHKDTMMPSHQGTMMPSANLQVEEMMKCY